MEFLSQNLILLIIAIVIFANIILALWLIPKYQTSDRKFKDEMEFLDAENEARKTIAQIIVGASI